MYKLAQEDSIIQYNATPREIFDILTKEYGKDWHYWEPETIWKEVGWTEEESASRNSEHTRNKIQAIQVVLTGIGFWKEWDVFEKVCLAFNSVPPKFDIIEDISPAQIAYGIRMANEIRYEAGLPGKMPSLSGEVLTYIAIRCYLDGLVYLPKPLDVAQPKLNELTGMAGMAEQIHAYSMNPDAILEETPVAIGAVRAKIISSYAYSNKRIELIK